MIKDLKFRLVAEKILKHILIFSILLVFNELKSQCGFTINITQTNNACNQTLNGALTANAVGPGANYMYFWKNSLGDTISTNASISNLESGAYVVIIHDTLSSCTQYKTAIIKSYYETDILETNISCPTCVDGIAELLFVGGTDTFSYHWDDIYSQQTRIASDLEENIYSIILTDSFNCTTTEIAEIKSCGENMEASIQISPPSCSTCNNAIIYTNISNGNPPYTYLWDDALSQTDSNAYNLDRHQNYTLLVTDFLGCQKSFTIDSTEFCKAAIQTEDTFSYNEPTCFNCLDGNIILATTGNYSPFSYNWENGYGSNDSLYNVLPGLYHVTVSDTIGCSIDHVADLRYCIGFVSLLEDNYSITNEYIYTNDVSQNDAINAFSLVSYFLKEKPKNGIINLQPDGNFSYKPYKSYSGNDFFTYQVFSDCGFSNEVNVSLNIQNEDMVWPGDVDKNGLVDNFDLLPLAVKYDSIGPLRLGASNSYYGQLATDWAGVQINGINNKNADCNGNGLVDSTDVTVIANNYGVVHTNFNNSFVGDIPLKIIVPDTIYAGDTVAFKIQLGTIDSLANDVYGLAYTFNINPEIINTSYSKVVFNDSWFTPDANRVSVSNAFLEKGRIDIAQARLNHLNTSGSGDIGSIIIVIEEDLGEILLGNTVSLSQVKLIQNDETPLYLNKQTSSFIIDTGRVIDGIAKLNDFDYNISPNPSNGEFEISLEHKANYDIEISNVLGKVVYKKSFSHASYLRLNIDLTNGMYFVKVKNNTLESVNELVIFK